MWHLRNQKRQRKKEKKKEEKGKIKIRPYSNLCLDLVGGATLENRSRKEEKENSKYVKELIKFDDEDKVYEDLKDVEIGESVSEGTDPIEEAILLFKIFL